MSLRTIDPIRDAAIAKLLETRVPVSEPCVFVNCSRSIPDLKIIYGNAIPEPVLRHAICQSWKGILKVLEEASPRQVVFAHVDGTLELVVHARAWLRVHDNRVIFDLNWLPDSHPYVRLRGLKIGSAIKPPNAKHSAFLYK